MRAYCAELTNIVCMLGWIAFSPWLCLFLSMGGNAYFFPGCVEWIYFCTMDYQVWRQRSKHRPLFLPGIPCANKIVFMEMSLLIPEPLIFEDTRGSAQPKVPHAFGCSHSAWVVTQHPKEPGVGGGRFACLYLKARTHPPILLSWQEYLEILNNLKTSWLMCSVPFHKMSRIPICKTNEQAPIVLISLFSSAEKSAHGNSCFPFIVLSGESEQVYTEGHTEKSCLTFFLSQ